MPKKSQPGPPALEIVYRKPSDIKPDPKNARTHSAAQIVQVRASIDEFGFTNPILLRPNGTIGAGHGRHAAAMLAPILASVPTITLPGLTDAQWRAYALADNRIALSAGWDLEILKSELADLKGFGFDLALTGFPDLELGEIGVDGYASKKRGSGGQDPDEVGDPPADPVTRPGDIWIMGGHRLACGDSTSAETVAALLGGEVASLCLTDPPYGIGFEYRDHDDKSSDANAALVEAVFRLAPEAKVWTPGLMNLARDIARFGAAKTLCWHKGFAQAGNGLGGASTWEPVLVIPPKHRALANDFLDFKTDRVNIDGVPLREHHPCPKPVALFAHLAEAFCAVGGLIYEPFSGSGTTILAAEMTERRCAALELSPGYVDLALTRWQSYTGKTAHLEATGKTFAEVAADRAITEPAETV